MGPDPAEAPGYGALLPFTDPAGLLRTLGLSDGSSEASLASASSRSGLDSTTISSGPRADEEGAGPLCYPLADARSTAEPVNAAVHVVQGVLDRRIAAALTVSSFVFACAQITPKARLAAALSRIRGPCAAQLAVLLAGQSDVIDIDGRRRALFTERVSEIFMAAREA